MTAAKLKYPSTAFGELRRLAVMEHGKKKRAAEFISLWYGRHLVRKGFVRDEKRRRELFAPPSPVSSPDDSNPLSMTVAEGLIDNVGESFRQLRRTKKGPFGLLRRRRRAYKSESRQEPDPPSSVEHVVEKEENYTDALFDVIKSGKSGSSGHLGANVSSQSGSLCVIDIPSGDWDRSSREKAVADRKVAESSRSGGLDKQQEKDEKRCGMVLQR